MANKPLIHPLVVRGKAFQAMYKPREIPEYDNNKCITAIPEHERAEIADRIICHPEFDTAVQQLSTEKRIKRMKLFIDQYYEPFIHHLDYRSNLADSIDAGYVNRNPEAPEFLQNFKQVMAQLKPKWEKEQEQREAQNKERFAPYNYHDDLGRQLYAKAELSSYHGFHLVGHAGMGKTVTTRKIVQTLPQLLYHPHLSGQLTIALQIVWFVQNTPYDGSIKSLCTGFIEGISNLTEEKYCDRYQVYSSQTTTQTLMKAMATLCALYHLGVYILDEGQYLLHSRGQNRVWTINFLNDLTNTLGIPIVIMGTYPLLELLGKEFRQIRRGLEQPQNPWHPLLYASLTNENPVDDSWQVLMKNMWQYQFVKHPIDLDESWNVLFHELSLGVVDIVRKLFVFSQIRAMRHNDERLTKNIVMSVYKDYFSKIGKHAHIYRNRDWELLSELDDYPEITIDEFITRDAQIEAYVKPAESARVPPQEQNKSGKTLPPLATANEAAAEDLEDYSVDGEHTMTSVTKQNSVLTDDLRQIAAVGTKKGLAADQALEAAGYVVDPVEQMKKLSRK